MASLDSAERVSVETRAQWRAWLEANHGRADGVWLVTYRKGSGRPAPTYDEAVSEALCYGWVDSVPRALDDERTMLYYAPRKPRSGWSRPNKERIERNRAAGLMAPAGEQVVAAAMADGSWTLLDEVEDLVVPDDLDAALASVPGAREAWDGFPRSARRGILEWIAQAKRPDTRAKRVAETATKAGVGERANQWRPKDPPAAPPAG